MLDFICFVLIYFVFFDESLKTNINKLNTKKHTLYYFFYIFENEVQNSKNE